MAADGTIDIDTRIDEKGFAKGAQGLTGSLSKVFNVVSKIAKLLTAGFIGGTIINNLRNVTRSFDIMGSAVGEKIKPLSDAFNTLKGTFVNLIVQAFIPFIPFLITAVEWFTKMLSTVIQVVAALFGYKQTVGNIMTSAAADAKKAAKEVKGALAAFDQINVLQKQDAAGTGETGPTATPAPLTVPQELLDKVEKLKQRVLEFLRPAIELFEKLKKIVVETFEKITTWIKENPEKFRMFLIVLGLLVLAFIIVAATIWLVTAAVGVATVVWGAFVAVVAFLLSPIGLIILAIIALIAIIVILALHWDWVKERAAEAWHNIQEIWKFASNWFLSVVDSIKTAFGGALDWIKAKFESIFNGIKSFVRGVIDGIIGFISTLVENILTAVATVAGLTGGGSVGAVAAPANVRLPRLATGAVIPPNAQFAAIMGDQRSGRNIEAPESLIRQIVREETGKMQADISIRFEGSLAQLVRELKPHIDKENVRVGGSLVKSGVSI